MVDIIIGTALLAGIIGYWIAQGRRESAAIRERQQRLSTRGLRSHRLENPDWIPGHGGGSSG